MFGDDEDIDIEASVDSAFAAGDINSDGCISFEEYINLAGGTE
eukprot:CAMPEP_0117445934 /NCGR_PEP_ID=MMETSP0759-20121206/6064_1 /TAXON_ID=63605 /ORGANISM="Percolomonas cosmopolitus, Strain WS" /LENGTH=42 /DNA_ID= /DNA_START= /DNA_END= /DNA_ORIENTATION=